LQIDTDLLLITNTADDLFGAPTLTTLNDLEIEKWGGLVKFSRFRAVTHIRRVNFRLNYWR